MLEDLPESATESALEMSTRRRDFVIPAEVRVSADELESTISELRNGRKVAEYLSEVTENESHRVVLQRIIPHLDHSEVYVLGKGRPVVPEFIHGGASPTEVQAWNSTARGRVRGVNIISMDDQVDRILLRGAGVSGSGMNSQSITHELLHAATARRMADGRLWANQGTKLYETYSQINHLAATVGDARKKFMEAGGMSASEALDVIGGPNTLNPDELIAWGLTDKKFQDFLGTIKIGGENGFQRFVRLLADLLGIPPKEHSALTEIIRLTDELLDAPLDELKQRKFLQEVGAAMSAPPQ
jgi:hypothetical protein